MDFVDKKLAVLHQLSQEAEPVSLPELLLKLGKGYAERSVRRWISEMINEGLVEKIGEKRATKYRVPQKSRRNSGLTSCFSSESLKIIEHVQLPLYQRNPVAYADDWLDSYIPNKTYYIPMHFRMQLEKAGKRSKKEDPAGTYAHQIFNRLLIDLSYNSSRLEGNTYSLLDTQRLLLEGAGAEGKLDEEKVMILNHKDAIRYLVDNAAKIELNEQTIFTLHYLLSEGLVEARHSGKIRDHGVRIGGSTYLPFEEKKQLESRLQKIIHIAASIENPFEQSMFILVHLSYLQAFADVNKRTARLAANIPFIKENLVPLSFNDVDRDDYTSAIISIYEQQEVHPLLDLYVFSYMRTCALYDSTVRSLGFDEIRVRYRQQRRSLIREIILQKLVGQPLQDFVTGQTARLIKEQDQQAFLQNVLEDLEEIDQNYITGLGITPIELHEWLSLSSKETN
jgi:Fic family protein